jgi:hypothetical protein
VIHDLQKLWPTTVAVVADSPNAAEPPGHHGSDRTRCLDVSFLKPTEFVDRKYGKDSFFTFVGCQCDNAIGIQNLLPGCTRGAHSQSPNVAIEEAVLGKWPSTLVNNSMGGFGTKNSRIPTTRIHIPIWSSGFAIDTLISANTFHYLALK